MLLAGVAIGGCATLRYYHQAFAGHLDITLRKTAIARVLENPSTDVLLKQRLARVLDIRRFAIAELGLPDSGSYTDYADLERATTLWLLTAAPELSLQAKRWCYPWVGCLSYRGFFDRVQAQAAADRLARAGYDVHVTPGLAYSTLGFMNDPVLNTMLVYDDLQLAGIIFHELAHELLFVKGAALFNESFATAVAEVGQTRWARVNGIDPGDQQRQRARKRTFDCLLLTTRAQLERLYESPLDDAAKRNEKAAMYAQLGREYRALEARWGRESSVVPDVFNNAQLALVATYELAVPAFLGLLERHDGDLGAFYDAVRVLAKQTPADRAALLGPPLSCPDSIAPDSVSWQED